MKEGKDKKEATSKKEGVVPGDKPEVKKEGEVRKEAGVAQKKEVSLESKSVAKPVKVKEAVSGGVKLSGFYAFKLAMSSVYSDKGQVIPVTFLGVKPWVVSQVKRKETEGYNSVQIACFPQKNNRVAKAQKKHLAGCGFAEGARYIREVRQDEVEGIEVGQLVSINSLQKGDRVKLQSISKGHGFAGVVKRWGFKGGPASHGAKTHRTSGSIGNRTEPARVMPGKKMPGHYGVEKVSVKNVQVVDVIPDKNLILVKGPVPGSRHSLVFLDKSERK